jgi:uncharacterized protein (DUF1330 family)
MMFSNSIVKRSLFLAGLGLLIGLWASSVWAQEKKRPVTGLRAFARSMVEGPVIVVDMVTFKPGGEQHYDKYDAMGEVKLNTLGGQIIFRGQRARLELLDQSKAGTGDPAGAELNATKWDRVTIRKYPTKDAVLELGASNEYRAALGYRIKGVEKSFVYAFSGELPSLDGGPKRQHPMGVIAAPEKGNSTSDTIYMLNMLRFKNEGGEQKFFLNDGAPRDGFRPVPVLIGKGITPIIGKEVVDRLILARYPSKEQFLNMRTSDEYGQVSHFRTEAIEMGLVWPFSLK